MGSHWKDSSRIIILSSFHFKAFKPRFCAEKSIGNIQDRGNVQVRVTEMVRTGQIHYLWHLWQVTKLWKCDMFYICTIFLTLYYTALHRRRMGHTQWVLAPPSQTVTNYEWKNIHRGQGKRNSVAVDHRMRKIWEIFRKSCFLYLNSLI